MSNTSIRNLAAIRSGSYTPQQLAEALTDLQSNGNNVAQQVNASPIGQTPPPLAPSALTVTAGQGFFRAHISDNSPSYRGKEYFLEASENEAFTSPHKMHLGATTDHYVQLGEKTLHFRAYAGHATTGPSTMVYARNISGIGGIAPSVTGNTKGGQGYGATPYTTDTPPKRA